MLTCVKCGRPVAALDLPRITIAQKIALNAIASMLPGTDGMDTGEFFTADGIARALNVRCAAECAP